MTDPLKQPRVAALIVAAGKGERAGGGIPKQWREIAGQSVAAWSVAALDAHPGVDLIGLVVSESLDRSLIPASDTPLATAVGGATRGESVARGLEMLADQNVDWVLIHDVARPGISASVIDAVLDALNRHPGSAPALHVTAALWRGVDQVRGMQDRNGLWRAQLPPGYHLAAIRA